VYKGKIVGQGDEKQKCIFQDTLYIV